MSIKRFSTNYMVFLLVTDQLLTLVAFALAAYSRLGVIATDRMGTVEEGPPVWLYAIVMALWLFTLILLSAYDAHRIMRAASEVQIVVLSVMFASLALAGSLYLLKYELPRLLYLRFIAIDLLLLVGYRLIVRFIFRIWNGKIGHETRIVIIGAGDLGIRIAEEIDDLAWTGAKLIGFIDDDANKIGATVSGAPVLGNCDEATRIAKGKKVDQVIIALPPRAYQRLVNTVSELHRLPLRIAVVPDYFDLAFVKTRQESLGDIPLIGLCDSAIVGLPRLIKRTFDLAIATVTTIALLPIFLLVALAIKLDSKGPVIFKQQRVGENGTLFWMYKFRSMVDDAERRRQDVAVVTKSGQVIHKRQNDPRITRVGRWLRKTSLDELPQLFNVIKGEMSLVGPRPEMPWLVEQYETWQRQRFAVPQGITGWWQVNGRSSRLMHLNTQDDLYYIQNYSLLLDLQILWKTIGAVIKGRGAF